MLSRVASNLYWMSRYIERAENTARLLDVNLQLLIDFEGYVEGDERNFWEAIVWSTGDQELFRKSYEITNSETVTDFAIFSRDNPNSVLSCIFQARENARMIRDQITHEMWECINELYHFVLEQTAKEIWRGDVYSFFEEIKGFSERFQGLTDATYVRDDGYKFMQVGKFLERADQTSRILDLKYFMLLPEGQDVGGSVDIAGWVAVLRSCSAFDAYHQRYTGEVEMSKVAEFLLLERAFPRSLRFCLREVDTHLRALTGTPDGLFTNDPEKLSGRLRSEVIYTATAEIFEEGLHEYIDRIQLRLIDIANAIYGEYLALPAIDWEAEVAHHRSHHQAQQQQQ
jgi:uncharacterized alpha-E superfamily protein